MCVECMKTEAHLKGDINVLKFPSEKKDNQDLGDVRTRAASKPSSLSVGHLSCDYCQSVSLSVSNLGERGFDRPKCVNPLIRYLC